MRKSVSSIIAVIMLVLVVIIASGGVFFWIISTQSAIEASAGGNLEGSSFSECSKISLISMAGNKAVVQNTGCDTLSNITLLIDGVLTAYGLNAPLNPGDSAIITYLPLTPNTNHCLTAFVSDGIVSEMCSAADQNTAEAGYFEFSGYNIIITGVIST